MSDAAERYRWIADGFGEKVRGVPADRWDDPAPCEGWVARDVVRHLVEWLPAFFFEQWDIKAAIPDVDADPLDAWAKLDGALRDALADPAIADRVVDTQMGAMTFTATLDQIGTTDVFLHTWDLARATGQDETLDPDEVHRLLIGMEPWDEALRSSGHYGPRTPVPDDASEQHRLLAFIGRTV